jgi:hypothetical protein
LAASVARIGNTGFTSSYRDAKKKYASASGQPRFGRWLDNYQKLKQAIENICELNDETSLLFFGRTNPRNIFASPTAHCGSPHAPHERGCVTGKQ